MSTTPSSRSTASSPGVFPSTRATSPPSSPPLVPDEVKTEEGGVEIVEVTGKQNEPEDDDVANQRLAQLESLLSKSAKYVELLKEQMDQVRAKNSLPRAKPKSVVKPMSTTKPKSVANSQRKRTRLVSDSEDEREPKRVKAGDKAEENEDDVTGTPKSEQPSFQQPALVTGATLKDYQLEGVAWMAGLHSNGLSGILADEMGLGKTIQTITFHAYLRERTPAPFMVIVPLAVLDNWAKEFARFAPEIPVVTYYGTKEERANIRRTQMVMDAVDHEYMKEIAKREAPEETPAPSTTKTKGKGKAKGKAKAAPRGRGRGRGRGRAPTGGRRQQDDSSEDEAPPAKTRATARGRGGRRVPASTRSKAVEEAGSDEFEDSMTVDEDKPLPADQRNKIPLKPHQKTNFPVVVTTYQVVINDRAELAKYHWGFIVVDEGHRLKNFDCVLLREIKRIPCDSRMVLTGTPLQNNLSELWSLLNFVLPDVFGDLSTFQAWFDEGRLKSRMTSERETKLIHSLHDILRPFLLRRMKADVEMQLPPKKEYVLYTPLSERQRELYEVTVKGDKALRQYLIDQLQEESDRLNGREVIEISDDEEEVPLKDKPLKGRGLRQKTKTQRAYADDSGADSDDSAYFERLDAEQREARKAKEHELEEAGLQWQRRAAVREVNNKQLKNVIMQLRKVCQHPFLFHWPKDPATHAPELNEELVTASGKMMVLERLLDALFARGHKVLLFSQFTTMLDIIEDWSIEFKNWPVCRIDGSMDMESRREDIRRFQEGGDAPDAPRLFLLSTRSGGLGLNLVAADTVIFYDQDWNPQSDLQAQDRAHRIGQTKPVLIFRLLCAHTVETKIMQRATEKRKLEALVIAKGEFVNPTVAKRNKQQAMAELVTELHRLEGERIQVVPNTAAGKASVISDADLDMLLDRRPEVFADRRKGWTSMGQVDDGGDVEEIVGKPATPGRGVGAKKAARKAAAAFAVYEAPVQDGNVLGMMDGLEDEDE